MVSYLAVPGPEHEDEELFVWLTLHDCGHLRKLFPNRWLIHVFQQPTVPFLCLIILVVCVPELKIILLEAVFQVKAVLKCMRNVGESSSLVATLFALDVSLLCLGVFLDLTDLVVELVSDREEHFLIWTEVFDVVLIDLGV